MAKLPACRASMSGQQENKENDTAWGRMRADQEDDEGEEYSKRNRMRETFDEGQLRTRRRSMITTGEMHAKDAEEMCARLRG